MRSMLTVDCEGREEENVESYNGWGYVLLFIPIDYFWVLLALLNDFKMGPAFPRPSMISCMDSESG